MINLSKRPEGRILFRKKENLWLGIPLTFLVLAVASIALVWILSRIPLVRRIVG